MLPLEYDESKRLKTLAERGLDFADAASVFAGVNYTLPDNRQDYGENRYATVGFLDARLVFVVWTYRPNDKKPASRRIISMRKANEREIKRFSQYLN